MWYNVNRRESEQLTSQFSYISIIFALRGLIYHTIEKTLDIIGHSLFKSPPYSHQLITF